MNWITACLSDLDNSRRAHDMALTTISSWSDTSNLHIPGVRSTSPVPPRARKFSGAVLTSADRRI
ncbi:MAG: hypothetical protein Q8N05_10795 [Bacteroidota bacterium]|nr:hypothetical protein [Bacteroidota bacterium]